MEKGHLFNEHRTILHSWSSKFHIWKGKYLKSYTNRAHTQIFKRTFTHANTEIWVSKVYGWLVPEAARSKAWVCGRSLAEIVGSNPPGYMDVFLLEYCVSSCRFPCVGLISRSEESYRLRCAVVCHLETS